MDTITVNKEDLLKVIRTNRDKHVDEYNEAHRAWRQRVAAELRMAASNAEDGKEYKTHFDLPKPENHADDYARAIDMLEFHVEPTIEVSSYEFRQYVNDEWDWSSRFKGTNSRYTVS